MKAVVCDLFGTLVPAPTPADRWTAACKLAHAAQCNATAVDDYFQQTWLRRHDGTLPTVRALVADLVSSVKSAQPQAVADAFMSIANTRLTAPQSVVAVLERLHSKGVRIALLSDASADISAAWPSSLLSRWFDSATFSCDAGAVKPDQRLYSRVHRDLKVPAPEVLYVGDGGGDELRGAEAAGMNAVRVPRLGGPETLVFGQTTWNGPTLGSIDDLLAYSPAAA